MHTACFAEYSRAEFNIRALFDANPIAMIQKTNDGETPYQLACESMNICQENDVDRHFFVEKQDEAVELVKAQVSMGNSTWTSRSCRCKHLGLYKTRPVGTG